MKDMRFLAAAAGLVVIVSAVASAQEAAEEGGGGLAEIVVTAQKRSQNLQEVPIAITAVNEADIARLNATDLKDLQLATPSLVIAGNNATQLSFGIRGIADRSRNAGYDNRVGVYVDGVWVGRSAASNQSALDVASVEILRGPQGTLFGKNTVAGAINITTRRPEQDFAAFIETEIGNYDLRRVRATANAPFGGGAAAKVTAALTRRDGFTTNVFNGLGYDEKDDFAIRGQVLLPLGESTELYLSGDHFESDFRGLSGERVADAAAPRIHQVSMDGLQDYKIHLQGGSAQLAHEFGDGHMLTSISAYRRELSELADFDEDFTSAPVGFSTQRQLSRHFSQELRLSSPSGKRFDYVLGLYYLDQKIDGHGDARVLARALNPALPATFVSAVHDEVVNGSSFAAFAHGSFRLIDRLQLTAGIRYTHEKKAIDYDIADTSGLFTTGSANLQRSTDDFSPTASLNWFVNDDVMAYIKYAKGFKSGGYNADLIRVLSGLPFGDEKVDSFEAGLKTTLFDDHVRFNLAAYQAKYDDFQVFSFVQLPTGGTVLTATNAGKVTTRGVEIDMQAQATDWLTLFAAYGYNDAKFDSFKDGGGAGIDFDGNRPSESPKHMLNLGAEFRWHAGPGDFVAQFDYSYRSSYFSNPDNRPVNLNQSLELVNLRAGYDADRWSLFIWSKNLLDIEQQIYNTRSFLGVGRASFTDPQTYGVTLKVKFGR